MTFVVKKTRVCKLKKKKKIIKIYDFEFFFFNHGNFVIDFIDDVTRKAGPLSLHR